MEKLYHIFNENYEITHGQFFIEGEQPANAIYVEFQNFIKPMVNPETWKVYEGASQEEINQVRFLENVKIETEKYKQRMIDGQAKYAEISAKFRLMKLTGVITEDSQRDIENLFKPVRNEVLAGQWVDAKIQLELLEQISIDMGKHDLYLEIWNIINDYILQSYTTYEIQLIQRNAGK